MNRPAPDIIASTGSGGDGGGSLYVARRKIHPRKVTGQFQRLRLAFRVLLIGGVMLLPWLTWNGEPLIYLDLPGRRFHILGGTFFPDDVFIAGWLLIIGAFALFTFTNVAGRVFCGYACPHSTFFSLFIALEEAIEGSALKRRKLDQGGLDGPARLRRVAVWAAWLGVSAAFAFSSMAYFVPARELAHDVLTLQVDGWPLFWIGFLTAGCFMFAGFLREQACFYMCPYARFQAAMYDRDTLVVSYDAARGEPRSARKRGGGNAGDCVDCHLCVDVCPVGIDIREGLQYQCIQCGLCVDACKPVMEKLGRPTGLIRYTTQNYMERGLKAFRLRRPRLLGYAAVLTLMSIVFVYYIGTRVPFDLEVIRERHDLYRSVTVADAHRSIVQIENNFRLKVANKTDQPQRFELRAAGVPGIEWRGSHAVNAGPGEIVEMPVRLRIDQASLTGNITKIHFELRGRAADGKAVTLTREQHFFGPSR